eukprot:Nk52_evm11s24 gene=Nk52_evmTU11s24
MTSNELSKRKGYLEEGLDLSALVALVDRLFLNAEKLTQMCRSNCKVAATMKKTSSAMPFCSIAAKKPKPHQRLVSEESHASSYVATSTWETVGKHKPLKTKLMACCHRNGRGKRTKTPLVMFVTTMPCKYAYTYVAVPKSTDKKVRKYMRACAEVTANTSFRIGSGLLNPEGSLLDGNPVSRPASAAQSVANSKANTPHRLAHASISRPLSSTPGPSPLGRSSNANSNNRRPHCAACDDAIMAAGDAGVCTVCVRVVHKACCVVLDDAFTCFGCGGAKENVNGVCCVCSKKGATQHFCDVCSKQMHQIEPCGSVTEDDEGMRRRCSWCDLRSQVKARGKRGKQGSSLVHENVRRKLMLSHRSEEEEDETRETQDETPETPVGTKELQFVIPIVRSQASHEWHLARKFSITSTGATLVVRFLKGVLKQRLELDQQYEEDEGDQEDMQNIHELSKIFKNFQSAEGDVNANIDLDTLLNFDESSLKSKTVIVLKQYCRSLSIKVGGNKGDLIKRILASIEEYKVLGGIDEFSNAPEVKKKVFAMLIDKWFMKPISGTALAKGRLNEDDLAKSLPRFLLNNGKRNAPTVAHPAVKNVSKVRHHGLLADKELLSFSTSVDGIVDICFDEGDNSLSFEVVAVEIKTRISFSKIEKLDKVGSNTVGFCDFGDDLFLEIVDDVSHRTQILHHAAVLRLNRVAYVVGVMKGPKFCLFVRFSDKTLELYRKQVRHFLTTYTPFLVDGPFPAEEDVPISRCEYVADYHTFKLYYYLWKDMHRLVGEVGEALPGMKYIHHAPYAFWNRFMGMIDKNSKRGNHAGYLTSGESLNTKIFHRFIGFVFLNADLVYRFILCQLFGDFDTEDATLTLCRKRMNYFGSFRRFLKAVVYNRYSFDSDSHPVGKEKENDPDAQSAAVPSTAMVRKRRKLLSAYMFEKPKNWHSSKGLVNLFNTNDPLRQIRQQKGHVPNTLGTLNMTNDIRKTDGRKNCVLCSYPCSRRQVSNPDHLHANQTSSFCKQCTAENDSMRIHLCKEIRCPGIPSCFDRWHSNMDKKILSIYDYVKRMKIPEEEKQKLIDKHDLGFFKTDSSL